MITPSVDDKKRFLKSFLLELVVYGAFVSAYFILVLHYLSGWIKGIFDQPNKTTYAIVSVGLMICQGLVLEIVTSALLKFIRDRTS